MKLRHVRQRIGTSIRKQMQSGVGLLSRSSDETGRQVGKETDRRWAEVDEMHVLEFENALAKSGFDGKNLCSQTNRRMPLKG
jgi:hypothetical protein